MAIRSNLVTIVFKLIVILVCTSYLKASIASLTAEGNTQEYLVIEDRHEITQADQLKTRISNELNSVEGKTIRNVLLSDGTSGLVLSLDKDELAKVRSTSGVLWVGKRDEQFAERTSSGQLKKVGVSNQFVVTVKPNTDEAVKRARTSFIEAGFEIIRNFQIGDFRGILVKGDSEVAYAIQASVQSSSLDVPATIGNIRENIGGLEADFTVYASDCDRSQPSGDELWGLSRINVKTRPSSYFNQSYGWSNDSDGTGVEVHVFDSGVNIEHVDFQGRAIRGFTARYLHHNEGDNDLNGHGTHVAGTVGGATYGVAKGVTIVAVKVMSKKRKGHLAFFLEGIQWSYKRKQQDPKRKIVWNISLGGERNSSTMRHVMKEVNKIGIVVVVAAGNKHKDACKFSPAFSNDVITVAASSKSDGFLYKANYGKCVDIVAPGEGIRSASNTSNTSSYIDSGTSMACPHVAGAVARFLSACPGNPSMEAVRNWLKNTATEDVLRNITLDTVNLLLYAPCDLDLGSYCGDAFNKPLVYGLAGAGGLVLIAGLIAVVIKCTKCRKGGEGREPLVEQTSSTNYGATDLVT